MVSTRPPEEGSAPAKTLFNAQHHALGGHMVPFAGWEMPLYYTPTGIMKEHQAVREGVGVFDVSHMGIVTITGTGAADLMARRTPLNAQLMKTGSCKYTFFLNSDGLIIDDAILDRLDAKENPEDFLLVPNASMVPRILELLLQHRPSGTVLQKWNGKMGILAVQGPKSRELLESKFGWDLKSLKFYTMGFFPWGGGPVQPYNNDFEAMTKKNVLVSRTGYTGELGYEIFLTAPMAGEAWKKVMEGGAVPCGLGARDTLRMEKGYLLSGSDFHSDKTPLEAGLDKFLTFDHPYVGREALEAQKKGGDYPLWTGISIEEAGAIPRHGASILKDGTKVGQVTSGGQSPTLGHAIALTYLPAKYRGEGTMVDLDVRGHMVKGKVVPLPFVK
jgi:aminomethyltransferase